MRRAGILILTLLITLSFLGCSANGKKAPSDEPGMIGYVMSVENEGILVVSQKSQDFSATGGLEEFYNAIWFSKAPKDIKIGDKVKVWYDVVRESYPGQSEIKHIEVIAAQKPDGANLTESEALNRALAYPEINTSNVIVVNSITYDKQKDQWSIRLKEALGDKVYDIQVKDN